MSNPGLAAVEAGNPLAGVKRGLSGRPGSSVGGLPAFRGRRVEPGQSVKAPKLNNGNRPNRGTNITIPLARVTPLEFLSTFCGRVAPGDVVFTSKTPISFMSGAHAVPDSRAALGQAHAHVTRIVGIDGMNKILFGPASPGGTWIEGVNCFRATPSQAHAVVRAGWRNDDVLETDPRHEAVQATVGTAPRGGTKLPASDEIKRTPDMDRDRKALAGSYAGKADFKYVDNDATKPVRVAAGKDSASGSKFEDLDDRANSDAIAGDYAHETDLLRCGRFRIAALNEFTLDGVVISNDEPESFTSNGAIDATLFNLCISGPTMVNNGFLSYDGAYADALPAAADLRDPNKTRDGSDPYERNNDGTVQKDADGRPLLKRGGDVGNIRSGLNRRTVEAHPRGSLESERHMEVPISRGAAANGGSPWLPDGMHDFVAAFTGGYTQFPQQARRAARRAARSHPRPAAVQFLRTRPVRRCSIGTLSRPMTSLSDWCASRCLSPTLTRCATTTFRPSTQRRARRWRAGPRRSGTTSTFRLARARRSS